MTFRLDETEANSELWMKLKEHMETRLTALRLKNDVSASLEQTERLRGEIKTYKYLLALDQPAPAMVADDD